MIPYHPLAEMFPPIEGAAFDDLVDDIRANDLREKIVVIDGAILDGRNRYRAALAAGRIDTEDGPDRARYFVRFVPLVDGDPLAFVVSKNLKRRHLSDNQRASIAGKIANLGRGRPTSGPQTLTESPPIGGISVEKAASIMEATPRQVERARVVHQSGVRELREAIDRDEIALSVAEKIARLPEQQQPAELAKVLPHGNRAIMASRQEPDDSLDYFPTPPFATRAFCEHVLPRFTNARSSIAWEPACGEGHMAEALSEYFRTVIATDVHDYGYGQTFDFLAHQGAYHADWIITNPPFSDKSEQFVLRALDQATVGVAMFLRLQWLESIGRYERIFKPHPPALIAQFAERVPLHKGRFEPDGVTATAYLWIVWSRHQHHSTPTQFMWIPPGQREALTRADDAERFTAHPVIKKELNPLHDPDTGEILGERMTEEELLAGLAPLCPPEPEMARATCLSPAPFDLPDIPDFLRR